VGKKDTMARFEPRPRSRHEGSRGQALVEFALVIIAFMMMFLGVIEFGVAFSVREMVNFASRDGSLMASESGSSPNIVDGAVLNTIDKDMNAPADKYKIIRVDIYWADETGAVKNGAIERYTPGGTLYPGWGGWTQVMDDYPGPDRCPYIGGTGCLSGHTGPDTLGVTIEYRYSWITPLPGMIGIASTHLTFTETNLVTMEPVPAI
jgi:hypothetical protein